MKPNRIEKELVNENEAGVNETKMKTKSLDKILLENNVQDALCTQFDSITFSAFHLIQSNSSYYQANTNV